MHELHSVAQAERNNPTPHEALTLQHIPFCNSHTLQHVGSCSWVYHAWHLAQGNANVHYARTLCPRQQQCSDVTAPSIHTRHLKLTMQSILKGT